MFYRPRRISRMWDTWVQIHDGRWYLFYLATETSQDLDTAAGTLTTWEVPGQPTIQWGLGIGVIIDPLDGDSDVTFVSAGVELLLEEPAAVAVG